VTILTDIADYPPHFWIEPQDQYVICGSDRAVRQARSIGILAAHILQASGMIMNPKFYTPILPDRRAERIRLCLDPDRPTGLVLFGGEGSMELVKIARALNQARSGIQLILICGKHEKAAAELRAMQRQIPMFVEGFTREIPFYMELSDFFIGKPGPGSISEALAKGLPVIVQRNAWTLAHERYNADWVEEQGLGVVATGYWDMQRAVAKLLDPVNFPGFRERARSTRNTAVYEIPDMLEQVLSLSRLSPERHFGAQSIPENVHSV
jgi:1,2-diacylglycerol 3-beta-galactosyltransferase